MMKFDQPETPRLDVHCGHCVIMYKSECIYEVYQTSCYYTAAAPLALKIQTANQNTQNKREEAAYSTCCFGFSDENGGKFTGRIWGFAKHVAHSEMEGPVKLKNVLFLF